ncbi:MAG: phosphodiester glycosidase family protein [Chlamydiota bacterium]
MFWLWLCFASLALSAALVPQSLYRQIHLSESPAFKGRFGEHLIHMIEIDLERFDLVPVKALDRGIGRMSVLELALLHGAAAGINGGFFEIGGTYDGLAAGALKIGDWYALPTKPRAAIGWSPQDRYPKMDRLLVTVTGTCRGKSFPIDGLNRKRDVGEMVLFSPLFHHRTLTHSDGEEVVICGGKVISVHQRGNVDIPLDGYVLSINREHPDYGKFKRGDLLTFTFNCLPQTRATTADEWARCQFIVGGTPLLIQNGVKIDDFSSERTRETFLSGRHARTAVGILPNGHWVLVVVDRTDTCDGMTMSELCDLMADVLHCTHAINMDGGGSATMVCGNEVKNDPRGDEDEANQEKIIRRVSDAILVVPT